MNDAVEFYSANGLVAAVKSSIVPTSGSYINIRGKTWEITSVSFALDHADSMRERGMRANVELIAATPEEANG